MLEGVIIAKNDLVDLTNLWVDKPWIGTYLSMDYSILSRGVRIHIPPPIGHKHFSLGQIGHFQYPCWTF